MSNKNLVFNAAVRGFHINRTNWKPQDGQLLKCTHKEDNPYIFCEDMQTRFRRNRRIFTNENKQNNKVHHR